MVSLSDAFLDDDNVDRCPRCNAADISLYTFYGAGGEYTNEAHCAICQAHWNFYK